eukprot:2708993-Rhodomonas_salina.3
MSGTEQGCFTTRKGREVCARSIVDVRPGTVRLRTSYAVTGTDLAQCAVVLRNVRYQHSVWCYTFFVVPGAVGERNEDGRTGELPFMVTALLFMVTVLPFMVVPSNLRTFVPGAWRLAIDFAVCPAALFAAIECEDEAASMVQKLRYPPTLPSYALPAYARVLH